MFSELLIVVSQNMKQSNQILIINRDKTDKKYTRMGFLRKEKTLNTNKENNRRLEFFTTRWNFANNRNFYHNFSTKQKVIYLTKMSGT